MKTVGLSPKIRASLVAVVASASSVVTSVIETGAPSDVALGALATAVFTAVGTYIAGPGTVTESSPYREYQSKPDMIGEGKLNGLAADGSTHA